MEKDSNSDTPMKILDLSSKGRALNLSIDDLQSFTNSLQNHTSGPMEVREIPSTPSYIGRHTDLSDVSLDNDDNMDFQFPMTVKPAVSEERVVNKGNSLDYSRLKDFFDPSTAATVDATLATCKDNDKLYETGDKLQRGCEEVCICTEGPDGSNASWECAPRCLKPYFRKGRGLTDPLCSERAVEDPCCAILVCAADDTITKSSATMDNSCTQNNTSHSLGSTWNVGCEKVCTCGPRNNVSCKPRCPPISPLEHCVNVQDPEDVCCLVQLCDVSQDVHEEIQVVKESQQILEERKKHNKTSAQEHHDMMTDPSSSNIKMPEMASSTLALNENTTIANNQTDIITSVDVMKNGTVKVNLAPTTAIGDFMHLQISSDNGRTFSDLTLEPSNLITNLKMGKEYVLKAKNSEKVFKFTTKGELKGNETHEDLDHTENQISKVGCHQDGEFYEIGMEFNVGCTELCECTGPEQRECAALRCPSSVGLDVLDPGCVRWAPDPPSFVPRAPHCCAERMRCLSNGSCQYEGHEIPNWSEVPISLTGCERRCFCESGSLDCQSVCESVPAQPPPGLRCAARQRPGTVDVPGDDCCKQWGCVDVGIMVDHGNGNRTSNILQSSIRTTHPFNISLLPTIYPDNINIHQTNDMTILTNDKLGESTLHMRQDIPQITSIDNTPSKVMVHENNGNKQILSQNKNNYEYPGPYADPFYIQKSSKAKPDEKLLEKKIPEKEIGPKHNQHSHNVNKSISPISTENSSDDELIIMPKQHIALLTPTSNLENVQSIKLFTPNINNSKAIFKMSSFPPPKNGTIRNGSKYIPQKVKQQLNSGPLQLKMPTNYQKISSSSSKQGVYSMHSHDFVHQPPINPTKGPQYLYVTLPPPGIQNIGPQKQPTESNDSKKYQAPSYQYNVQPPQYDHQDSYIDVSDNIHHIAAGYPYVIHPAQQHYPNVQISQPASTKTPDHIKHRPSINVQNNFDLNNTIRNNYGKTPSPITANIDDISIGNPNPTIPPRNNHLPEHTPGNHALYHHESHIDTPKEVVISNTHMKHHPEYEPIDLHAILRQLHLQQTNQPQMTGRNDLTMKQTNEDRPSKGNDRLPGPTSNHNFVLPTHVNQFNGHPMFLPTVSPNNDFLPNVNEELIPENNDIRPPSKNKPSKHDNRSDQPGVNDVAHHDDNKNSGSNDFDTPVFHQIDSIGDNRLTVLSLKSDSPNSLKMLLGLPAVLVGLRGRMDLRYTDTDDDDVSQWHSQVYAPADEVLGTSRLEFRLTGLKPSTEYKVRGELLLHRMENGPISGIYTITTQDEPPVEEIRRPIDGALNLLELNSTSAELGWRHFSVEEQKYIDGIQIRYRPVGVAIYTTTELLHRSRVSATLAGLRADTSYEAALVLAPPLPPAPRIELYDERVINFRTPPIQDMYNWSVTLEATEVGSQSASVRWRGVADPDERYVSVYRAAHACEGDSNSDVGSIHEAAYKLPARGDNPTLRVVGLQPGTRCRVWLELFLTNGKTKTSNVLDILTKPSDNSLDTNTLEHSREAASTAGRRGDYYVPLVAVAVVAALGALSSLLLLLVLLRRHRPHSVSITSAPTAPTAPRALPTLPPYENPAYKLEYQQETMDL